MERTVSSSATSRFKFFTIASSSISMELFLKEWDRITIGASGKELNSEPQGGVGEQQKDLM